MDLHPLSPEERGRLRARMAAARADAERRLAALDRTFDELVAAADLEPPDDEHDPDGTTAYERAQVTSLAAAARATLRDLDRELARVDDPAYGACAVCRGPIGLDRLEAVPGTRTCVRCPGGRGAAPSRGRVTPATPRLPARGGGYGGL